MAKESSTTHRKRAFELLPTSMKGVYSFVPPPKSVDLTTASRRTLIKHGVLMRRPDPEREPKLFALWRRFVGEIWTEENFVVPTFGPPWEIPHSLRGLQSTEINGVYNSQNWSGCMVVGNWVGIMGVWRVPTVTAPPVGNTTATPFPPPFATDSGWQSGSWVGLNGGGRQLDGSFLPGTSSQDVLQAGIAQNFDIYNRPSYQAWYEWALDSPQADQAAVAEGFKYALPVPITSSSVNPGDEISVVIQFVREMGDDIGNPLPPAGPYHFGAILMVNVTTNVPLANLYLPPPVVPFPPAAGSFTGDTAEWIMECPNGPAPDNGSLPQFSSVTFQQAGACNVLDAPPGGWAGVALQNGNLINFQDHSGNIETNVSAGVGTVTINYQSPM